MAQPVTLADAKAHLKVEVDAEDDLIQMYVDAAQQHVEDFTGLVLEPRTIVEPFDEWRYGTSLRLRSWPVSAVSAFTYLDTNGNEQTLDPAAYTVAIEARPARLSIAGSSYYWPRTYPVAGAVTVTVEAGYASPLDVPASLKQAILMLVGHFHANRSAVAADSLIEMPLAVETLCRRYRFRRV